MPMQSDFFLESFCIENIEAKLHSSFALILWSFQLILFSFQRSFICENGNNVFTILSQTQLVLGTTHRSLTIVQFKYT